jgi:hypothetical protein
VPGIDQIYALSWKRRRGITSRSSTGELGCPIQGYRFKSLGVIWAYRRAYNKEESFIRWGDSKGLLISDFGISIKKIKHYIGMRMQPILLTHCRSDIQTVPWLRRNPVLIDTNQLFDSF